MYRLILEVTRGQGQPHAGFGRSAEDENRRWPHRGGRYRLLRSHLFLLVLRGDHRTIHFGRGVDAGGRTVGVSLGAGAPRWVPPGAGHPDGGRAGAHGDAALHRPAAAVVRAAHRAEAGAAAAAAGGRDCPGAAPAVELHLRLRPRRAASRMARRGTVGEHGAVVPQLSVHAPGPR